jgi:hypothetical protein
MRALYRMQSELLRLKWQLAALRFERALHRHALALKAYNPEQQRDELGKWTDGGGSVGPRVVGPGAGRDRATGHHYIPRSLYDKVPLSDEARQVFEEGTTGRLYDERSNRYDTAHRQYNDAVKEHFERFVEQNKIDPSKMTQDQARSFLKEITESQDSRIRPFNMRIQFREIMRRVLRSPRGID